MPKYAGERLILTNNKKNGKISAKGFQQKAAVSRPVPKKRVKPVCPLFDKCGGCQLQEFSYPEQLSYKQQKVDALLKKFGPVKPIVGMKEPMFYRNKVHAVMDFDRRGNVLSGIYQADTHKVVPVEKCYIEDEKADAIIGTIRDLAKSFKYKIYAEDTGYGLLRHVLVKRAFATGEIMVVLVLASPILPSKNNFVKALRKVHPEITTVIINVNDKRTSMVLGDKEAVIYGKGYIEDILCGLRFRISAKSFYQVNPVQTEVLYSEAVEYAGLTGEETVIDAYCGIGTIGLIASKKAGHVIGVELNGDAVKDAITNAKLNQVKNIRFFKADAGVFMEDMAREGEKADVVFMDPPRSGSDEKFLDAVAKLKPKRVVYVSCNPETLARDLEYLRKKGYEVRKVQPVDMFPWTGHVETVVLLERIA